MDLVRPPDQWDLQRISSGVLVISITNSQYYKVQESELQFPCDLEMIL